MQALLFSLALAGIVLLTSAATTTTKKTTTKSGMTTKPLSTAKTTARPATGNKRTRAPTTPHTLVDDSRMEMALDYIIVIIYNCMNTPDLPKLYSTTTFEEVLACITPEQKDEFSQVILPCSNKTDPRDFTECFFLSLLMDSSGTSVDEKNMVYIIEYTNLTSTQKTGAIARMQQCYKNETMMTRNLVNVLLSFEWDDVLSIITPILQNMYNGRHAIDQAAADQISKATEHLHVWKAMACIFEGLFTHGCSQIKPEIITTLPTTKSSKITTSRTG